MRTNILFASFVALTLALAISGCSSSPNQESTGQYIDSSAVTAKVKAAMLSEPGLKSMQIGVETYKDGVQLNGFVDSAEARNRAGAVARSVPGVKSVRNDLLIK